MRDLVQIGLSQPTVRSDDLRNESTQVAERLARYLAEHYRPKKGRSRHDLIKPVHKAIKRSLKPFATATDVAGYVAQLQERDMEIQTLPLEAYKELEAAVTAMFELFRPDKCPPHLKKAITDRLEDTVYLRARQAQQRFWDEWTKWLRRKYDALEKLNAAWGTAFENWDKVRFKAAEANDTAKTDFEQFKKDHKAAAAVVIDSTDEDQE
jgi:hypothetical protein